GKSARSWNARAYASSSSRSTGCSRRWMVSWVRQDVQGMRRPTRPGPHDDTNVGRRRWHHCPGWSILAVHYRTGAVQAPGTLFQGVVMSQVNTDKLIEDLRQVVRDAEDLLRATAGQAGEKIAEARARAEESLRIAKG